MEPFLPKHYILKRWTRDANESSKKGINDCCFEGNDIQYVKRNALTKIMDTIMNNPLLIM